MAPIYLFADAQTDEPNATLFSKADLSIAGNGSLTVEANYNDGIASKDGLALSRGVASRFVRRMMVFVAKTIL